MLDEYMCLRDCKSVLLMLGNLCAPAASAILHLPEQLLLLHAGM
jgi:hypothetical protein